MLSHYNWVGKTSMLPVQVKNTVFPLDHSLKNVLTHNSPVQI